MTVENAVAQAGKHAMVTEFAAHFGTEVVASRIMSESLMAALYDATALQQFTRAQPTLLGAIEWGLDADGTRLIHCSRTAAVDDTAHDVCLTNPPYNSVVGWAFSLLRQYADPQWVSTDTSAPTFTESQTFRSADGLTITSAPNSTMSEVQALATLGTGRIDVQLVNLSNHPVDTAVDLAGASPTGSGTLVSLGGTAVDTIDGCRRDALNTSWGCNATALAPSSTTIPTAAETDITLPASSLSVLSIPTSG